MLSFGGESMTAYRLDAGSDSGSKVCGRIGGTPKLPASSEWPRCRMCNAQLIAFLEIVLPACASSQFAPGSRLQVFACRQHDDIAGPVYSDHSAFSAASRSRTLPPEYWNITDGHYLLRLLPPSEKTIESGRESRLLPQSVAATATDDDTEDGFKLFGEPYWLQDAEPHECSCGAPMRLLLQIPEGYGFRMADGAEEQPNSFSHTEYGIFLGNQLYLLGCTKQCHPLALWPVLQS
jgi:hypothetical protein